MEHFNKLITLLLAIRNFCKDIHYSCHGESFYSKHLFVDRIQEHLNEYIDQIKEVCILGNDKQPLASGEYLSRATSLIPLIEDTDLKNFVSLGKILLDTLECIDTMTDLTVGEENLMGKIAQDLQNSVGLLNYLIYRLKNNGTI